MKISVLLLAIGLLSGCTEKLSLSTDPVIAADQIRALIPVGTPKEEAKQIFLNNGIACSENEGDFGKDKLGKYLYGEIKSEKGFIITRWQCAIQLLDDRTFLYLVHIDLTGP
jgi:hypothetical protein